MKIRALFNGYPARLENWQKDFFEHGKTYDLEIEEYFCAKGYMKGEMAPVIKSPYKKKYVSWKTFWKDWQKV